MYGEWILHNEKPCAVHISCGGAKSEVLPVMLLNIQAMLAACTRSSDNIKVDVTEVVRSVSV